MRAMILAAATCLVGCSLLANPDDHVGGGRDASQPFDASSSDAGRIDGGREVDAGPPDAASPDASSTDAGSPPPECATDAECGPSGLARCVDERCVFCIAPPTPILVGSSSRYDDHLSMAIGSAPDRHEIALAWTGSGNDAYLFRTPLGAAVAPGSMPSRGDALLDQVNTDAIADIVGVEVASSTRYREGQPAFEVSVVTRDTNRSSQNFALWTPTGFTSETYPDASEATDPARLLAPLVFIGNDSAFVAVGRRTDASGVTSLVSYETAYGNEQATLTVDDLPATDYADMTAAGRMVGVPVTGGLILWDTENGYKRFPTGGRTGRVALSRGDGADEIYLLAYPAGAQIRVRAIRCTHPSVPSCAYDPTLSADIETGAAFVGPVSVASSLGHVVLLSHERRTDGSGRLLLRVLRDNGVPYDAPGGGTALVLDTLPAGEAFLDARLALALDGTAPHYVAAWIRGPSEGAGERQVHLASTPRMCAP